MFRGPEGSGVAQSDRVVLDLDTKRNQLWRTELPEAGWSSPITDGKRLWMTSALTHDVASGPGGGCTPISVNGKVIIATGYGGNDLVAMDPKGSGDVTETHVLWRQSKGMPLIASPTCLGDHLFSVTDTGIIHAMHQADGEIVWRERLGGKFSASLFASGDRLLIGDHSGNVTVFPASQSYEAIARYESKLPTSIDWQSGR